MTRHDITSQPLEHWQVPVQFKLAAAWTSIMFLYIYVDYLHLYRPGAVQDILVGIVWELEITQTFAAGALVMMSIPSLMITLSIILPVRAARATNLVAATLFVPLSIFNIAGESWVIFYGYGIVVEVILLVYILRAAWNWPRTQPLSNAASLVTSEPAGYGART